MSGVIHIGAHLGEEFQYYIKSGKTPIWAFEPNPSIADRLRHAFDSSVVEVEECALGESNESRMLWIPNSLDNVSQDTASASFLRADRKSGYDWGERDRQGSEVSVAQRRFDSVVAEQDRDLTKYDTVVIDVQGYELAVLVGFGNLLWNYFQKFVIECSESPIYRGGSYAFEVVNYMRRAGFEQTSPILVHGDIQFTRQGK